VEDFVMRLYRVEYKTWNWTFSNLIDNEMLSVGNNEEEAIQRVKSVVEKDARDFEAMEINNIFGYNILVENN
jgi:hypothetical protein